MSVIPTCRVHGRGGHVYCISLCHRNPDYIKYKNSTPLLLPGIPPLYRVTPYVFKLLFCCEFPFYSVKPDGESDGKSDSNSEGTMVKATEETDKLSIVSIDDVTS